MKNQIEKFNPAEISPLNKEEMKNVSGGSKAIVQQEYPSVIKSVSTGEITVKGDVD